MAKKNILALEQRVKDIYAEDKTDPELYVAIKDLAEAILVVKRMVPKAHQVAEISHNLATDFYMKISTGELEVKCWTKYIMLRLRTYRGQYYSNNRRVDLIVEDTTEAQALADNLYNSSKFQFSKSSTLEMEDLIEYYPQFLLKQFDKCVRYVKGTPEYSHTLISVMMALIRGESNKYVFRCWEDYEYVEFLRKILTKRLENYSNLLCEDKRVTDANSEELVHYYKSFIED